MGFHVTAMTFDTAETVVAVTMVTVLRPKGGYNTTLNINPFFKPKRLGLQMNRIQRPPNKQTLHSLPKTEDCSVTIKNKKI